VTWFFSGGFLVIDDEENIHYYPKQGKLSFVERKMRLDINLPDFSSGDELRSYIDRLKKLMSFQ
jgi:hypothetical protein